MDLQIPSFREEFGGDTLLGSVGAPAVCRCGGKWPRTAIFRPFLALAKASLREIQARGNIGVDMNLSGKRACVCGSTQGIGKAAAVELASLGAAVTLVARNSSALQIVCAELPTPMGQRHSFLAADFTDSSQLKEMLASFLKENPPFHILVNNTGGPNPGEAIAAKEAEFLSAFSQHLICNHILVQSLMEGMKRFGYGRIINVISTSVKEPIKGLGVSNTVRGAVAGWAKTLATELGRYGITVNNVLPGPTKTERWNAVLKAKAEKTGRSLESVTEEALSHVPLGRFAEPSEIASMIGFLASPAASFVTGTSIAVDGGRMACI